MEKLFIVFFLLAGLLYAQEIPHKSTLTASKYEVKSDEEFTITYTLTDVEGYVYIGVIDRIFEVLGESRWEGYIKWGEIKILTFRLKLRENVKNNIDKIISLGVGFSYFPLGSNIGSVGDFEMISIAINDYESFSPRGKQKGNSLQNIGATPLQYHSAPGNFHIRSETFTPGNSATTPNYPSQSDTTQSFRRDTINYNRTGKR